MTKKEKNTLSILCGALQDVSESCKDKSAAKKIKEIQLMVEETLIKNKNKIIKPA